MFSILNLKMQIDEQENGRKQVTIAPMDLYPAIILRILDCLNGANVLLQAALRFEK